MGSATRPMTRRTRLYMGQPTCAASTRHSLSHHVGPSLWTGRAGLLWAPNPFLKVARWRVMAGMYLRIPFARRSGYRWWGRSRGRIQSRQTLALFRRHRTCTPPHRPPNCHHRLVQRDKPCIARQTKERAGKARSDVRHSTSRHRSTAQSTLGARQNLGTQAGMDSMWRGPPYLQNTLACVCCCVESVYRKGIWVFPYSQTPNSVR
jgi:hypothetical protein